MSWCWSCVLCNHVCAGNKWHCPLLYPFDNVMTLFTYIDKVAFLSVDVNRDMLSLELLRLRFSRWGAGIVLSDEVVDLKKLCANVRKKDVSTAKDELARMVQCFEDFAKTTNDEDVEGEVSDPPGSDASNRKVLVATMRALSDSRQCKDKTLRRAKPNFLLRKFFDKEFRRQCTLCSANLKWIVAKTSTSSTSSNI